jgi:rhodanese-related sulfurtransferase
MSGQLSFSCEKLAKLIGTPFAPAIIDVRLEEDFQLDPRLLPTSKRVGHLDWKSVAENHAGQFVVIVCQRGAKLSHGFAAQLRIFGVEAVSLSGGFESWNAAGLPLIPQSSIPGSQWVTRQRPKIDRIACPWLIRRFVSRDATFLFVPTEDVEGVAQRFGATPFDMPSGFWSHEGPLCTFDKMLKAFNLQTKALMRLSTIIRAADTDRLQDAPEAAGLLAISLGLSRQFSDDLAQLEAGMAIYDALYRWCRDATDETHNWPTTKPLPA